MDRLSRVLHRLLATVLVVGFSGTVCAETYLQDPGPDGMVVIDAEAMTPVNRGAVHWEEITDGEAHGGAAVQALPDSGSSTTREEASVESSYLEFAIDFKRDVVFAAKDRMDFTIDRVRSLRTSDNLKYIRNFFTDRPYMQLNYRHGREYMVRMVELFAQGKLSDVQARFWSNYRPAEELYDLNNDPHEIHNLAANPTHREQLEQLRARMNQWIADTDDKG